MKRLSVIVCLLVISFAVTSCSVNPSEFNDDQAKELVSKLTYAKDERTGLCFAMVASRMTGTTDQSGLGITEVHCDKVEHMLAE